MRDCLSLAERSYWQRAWIIQENFLANKKYFHALLCGNQVVMRASYMHFLLRGSSISKRQRTGDRKFSAMFGLIPLLKTNLTRKVAQRMRQIEYPGELTGGEFFIRSTKAYTISVFVSSDEETKNHLLSILYNFRFTRALNPCDKIYSLLGCISNSEVAGIPIRYHAPGNRPITMLHCIFYA